MSNQLTLVDEFVPEDGKIPIFLLRPFAPSWEKCFLLAELGDAFQLLDLGESVQSAALLRDFGGIAISYSGNSQDLMNQVALLKLVAPFTKGGTVRSLALTSLQDKPVLELIHKSGPSELIQEPILPRTLEHKLRGIAQSLQDQNKTALTREREALELQRAKAAAQSAPISRPSIQTKSEVLWTDPMDFQSDCWFASDPPSAKILQNRWLIELLGPSDQTGRWKEFPERKSLEGECWGWIPHDPERDPFIKDAGHWFFCGEKPKITDHVWTFSGALPHLWFEFEGETFGVKFQATQAHVLRLARNSPNAEKLLSAMTESFTLSLKRMSQATSESIEPKQELMTLLVGCSDLMQDAAFLQLDPASRERRILDYLSSALELSDLHWDREAGAFRALDAPLQAAYRPILQGLALVMRNMVQA